MSGPPPHFHTEIQYTASSSAGGQTKLTYGICDT